MKELWFLFKSLLRGYTLIWVSDSRNTPQREKKTMFIFRTADQFLVSKIMEEGMHVKHKYFVSRYFV